MIKDTVSFGRKEPLDLKDISVPVHMSLCVNARVMLAMNIDINARVMLTIKLVVLDGSNCGHNYCN